jgi:hypothetical protein
VNVGIVEAFAGKGAEQHESTEMAGDDDVRGAGVGHGNTFALRTRRRKIKKKR